MTEAAPVRRFTGAVLCGGGSRRMGRDKALIELDGVPLAGRVGAALRAAGADPVLALGGDAPALEAIGLTVVADDDPGAGPLAAIVGALRRTDAPVVLAVACDLLAPDPAAMARVVDALQQAAGADVAVPVVEGRRQWAHAAWATSARDHLAAALAAGERSLRGAAAGLQVVEVAGLDAGALRDADRPEDLPPDGSPGGGAVDG